MLSVGDSGQGQRTAGAIFWKILLSGSSFRGTVGGEDERFYPELLGLEQKEMWRGFQRGWSKGSGGSGGQGEDRRGGGELISVLLKVS